MGQEGDLIGGLDHARIGHQLLAVHDRDSHRLQGVKDGDLDHVHAEWLMEQAALLELHFDLVGYILSPAHLG